MTSRVSSMAAAPGRIRPLHALKPGAIASFGEIDPNCISAAVRLVVLPQFGSEPARFGTHDWIDPRIEVDPAVENFDANCILFNLLFSPS